MTGDILFENIKLVLPVLSWHQELLGCPIGVHKELLGCAGGVRIPEIAIGEPSSNNSRVRYVHIRIMNGSISSQL